MAVLKTPRQKLIAAVFATAAIAGLALSWFIMSRGPSQPWELAGYLPEKDGTVAYLDVAGMRKSGLLNVVSGTKVEEEADYKDFVQQTGFDYRHDLDSLAATFRSGQTFFALKGHFDWDKLEAYARKRGGSCRNGYCAVDGSQPGRRISFHKLAGNLMGMAVSGDDMAAYQVSRNASKANPYAPDAPAWVMMPSTVLKEVSAFPAGVRAFALALQSADRALFSAAPEGDHLRITMNVTCKDTNAASALLVQLEDTTSMLRKLISREHQQPGPADLAAVLMAGTFRRDDRRVVGQWPVQRAFVDAVAGK